MIRPGVPLEIDYTAEITPPRGTPAGLIAEVAQSARLCGTRMLYSVSEPSTYFDKVGHAIPPRLRLDGATMTPAADHWLLGKDAELDNGFLRYRVRSAFPGVWARDDKAKNYCGVYSMAREANGRLTGGCHLTIAGQSRFE